MYYNNYNNDNNVSIIQNDKTYCSDSSNRLQTYHVLAFGLNVNNIFTI